jgi:hypothetical protein
MSDFAKVPHPPGAPEEAKDYITHVHTGTNVGGPKGLVLDIQVMTLSHKDFAPNLEPIHKKIADFLDTLLEGML